MRRFLFINATHPADSHVSALRVASFARAVARLGHEVYLLTRQSNAIEGAQSANARDQVSQPATLRVMENSDSGGRVLHIVAPGQPGRQSRGPMVLRRALTFANWLRGSSSDPDWVRSARSVLDQALADVDIDLVWATFTPIECWTIAQGFARQREVAFVADIKDDWQFYVPSGLRRLVAQQVGAASAFTANSLCHWDGFPKNNCRRSVIYSGYWRDQIKARSSPRSNNVLTGVFFGRTGGAGYDRLVHAMREWSLARQQPLHLRYFGASCDEMRELGALTTTDAFQLTPHGYVTPGELLEVCRNSDFNFYARQPNWAIHHKATELMAVGRPILVWGDETPETRLLAEQVGVPMLVSETDRELYAALDKLVSWKKPEDGEAVPDNREWLSWENQAVLLLQTFEKAISARQSAA